MTQLSSSNLNTLPGIVTDQPEIFESEGTLSDDQGVNDLDLNPEASDEAIALIEVPIQQAFSYFAERENEIARFYVQRHGEYKLSGDKPEDETDIEKYHRLVSEVNELLNKFQVEKASKLEDPAKGGLNRAAIASNLDVLSKQLRSLEFAANDGSLNPTQSGFVDIETKLSTILDKVDIKDDSSTKKSKESMPDDTSKLIRISALERRLNLLETVLGHDEPKVQSVLMATGGESLTDVAETLCSWLSLFKADGIQRVTREIDYLTQKLEKIDEQANADAEENKLSIQDKSKLDKLCDLVTSTDKYRAMVPSIIHRLNAMEELQHKAAQITTTVNDLEQIQSQIVERLQSNKEELSSLKEMFSRNMDSIKEVSADIDTRISKIRDQNQ